MTKPLAFLAAVLLLAGCSATDLAAPDPTVPDPTFAHAGTGCPVAAGATAGTAGLAGVVQGCLAGE